MSSLLGDYERPRRPFPIFSLSREDLHWTLLLCVVCFYVAIVVKAGQAEDEVKSAWKGCLVVFGMIFGFVFAAISAAKMMCGYGLFFNEETNSEYQNLEEAKQTDSNMTNDTSTMKPVQLESTLVSTIQTLKTQTFGANETKVVRSDERVLPSFLDYHSLSAT